MVWTAAGALYVIEEIEEALTGLGKDKSVQAVFRSPESALSRATLRQKLGDRVHQTVQKCYGTALPYGTNQLTGPQVPHHPFVTDCLFLGWSHQTAWFLEHSADGQRNWHTDARFYAVGSGGEFASVAQAVMAHHIADDLTVDDGMLVAYRAIATTCEVSAANVGLPVCLAVASEKGTRVLDPDEVRKIEDGVAGWKRIETDTFRKLRSQPTEAQGTSDTPADLPTFVEQETESADPSISP